MKDDPATPTGLMARAPHRALSSFVSHYWLGLANTDPTYAILPDGCVDLVFEITSSGWRGWAYGTTTRPTEIALTFGSHYLGVRFKPGQSRHFIDACGAELANAREDLDTLVSLPGHLIRSCVLTGAVFDELDRLLLGLLCRCSPRASYVDHVVHQIRAARGNVRIEEIAARVGKSRRQVERSFLETVGMTSKLYASIVRLEHAADLIRAQTQLALADVAVAAGYADQSHMTRDFVRLARTSPARLRQGDVAFLQYNGAL